MGTVSKNKKKHKKHETRKNETTNKESKNKQKKTRRKINKPERKRKRTSTNSKKETNALFIRWQRFFSFLVHAVFSCFLFCVWRLTAPCGAAKTTKDERTRTQLTPIKCSGGKKNKKEERKQNR